MLSKCTLGVAPDGQPFQLVTLSNAKGMSIQVMDWGRHGCLVRCLCKINYVRCY